MTDTYTFRVLFMKSLLLLIILFIHGLIFTVECSHPQSSNSALHVLNGTCNSFEREVFNEGNKPCVYNDHLGTPIVGIKFNLEREDAKERIAYVGADFSLVRSGKACLSDVQIRKLFDYDMTFAVQCTSQWLSSAWSKMSTDRQSAIADMAFSMGCSRVKTFKKMKAALQRRDYSNAEREMRDSRWCRQVRSRCDRATKCMRQE